MRLCGYPLRRDLPAAMTRGKGALSAFAVLSPEERGRYSDSFGSFARGRSLNGIGAEYPDRGGIFMQTVQIQEGNLY